MNHLAEHQDKMLIEEPSIALETTASRGCHTFGKKVELKELEKMHLLARRKIPIGHGVQSAVGLF